MPSVHDYFPPVKGCICDCCVKIRSRGYYHIGGSSFEGYQTFSHLKRIVVPQKSFPVGQKCRECRRAIQAGQIVFSSRLVFTEFFIPFVWHNKCMKAIMDAEPKIVGSKVEKETCVDNRLKSIQEMVANGEFEELFK